MTSLSAPSDSEEDASFAALMRAQGVTPLPPRERVELAPPKKTLARPSPNAPKNDIDIDVMPGEEAPESYLRADQSPRVLSGLRRGHWPIEKTIDLHGLTRDEALRDLNDFLAECASRRLRCVCVIHGKGRASPGGRAILKPMTRQWLARRPEVLAFCDASPRDGGDGALLALFGKFRVG
ncbi:MAG: Smr/MutS family protein [Zoogloeaceae bacterium]|jgi:DNA-nicking Smr family endonuclease|nr:Smr/MutS family protein [Zoogloeaceae bacterium]